MKRLLDKTYAPQTWKPQPLVKLGQGDYERHYTAKDFGGEWLRNAVVLGGAVVAGIAGGILAGHVMIAASHALGGGR